MNNDYASHMIILAALGYTVGHSRKITHVLELGCGLYSTPQWFNRMTWPHIKSVVSYEDNPIWRRHVRFVIRDPRFTLTDIWPSSINTADIILIDNGQDEIDRLGAIGYVTQAQNVTGMVILHDANEPQYMAAIEPHFDHCIIYTGAYPHTALLWNGDRWNEEHINYQLDGIEEYECLQLT